MNATIVVPLLFLGSSWLSPANEPLREAERLLAQGNARAAVDTLGQALADKPDSPLIAYNLGNAHYRAQQYEAAAQAYRRVRADQAGSDLAFRAAYNTGNALFRQAQAEEQEHPDRALAKYGEALVEYRRALGLVPGDEDAKFNYEYTQRKMEELRKRLEEMAKQQPTPEPDQQQQPTPSAGDRTPPEPTPSAAPNEGGEQQEPAEEQQPAGGNREEQTASEEARQSAENRAEEQAEASGSGDNEEARAAQEGENSDAGDGAAVAAGNEEPRDRREARALIDTARQEELSPAEFWRQQQHGVVAEPAQDW